MTTIKKAFRADPLMAVSTLLLAIISAAIAIVGFSVPELTDQASQFLGLIATVLAVIYVYVNRRERAKPKKEADVDPDFFEVARSLLRVVKAAISLQGIGLQLILVRNNQPRAYTAAWTA